MFLKNVHKIKSTINKNAQSFQTNNQKISQDNQEQSQSTDIRIWIKVTQSQALKFFQITSLSLHNNLLNLANLTLYNSYLILLFPNFSQ